jgi:hypothetical protein
VATQTTTVVRVKSDRFGDLDLRDKARREWSTPPNDMAANSASDRYTMLGRDGRALPHLPW